MLGALPDVNSSGPGGAAGRHTPNSDARYAQSEPGGPQQPVPNAASLQGIAPLTMRACDKGSSVAYMLQQMPTADVACRCRRWLTVDVQLMRDSALRYRAVLMQPHLSSFIMNQKQ
jgi:hypothetical protein